MRVYNFSAGPAMMPEQVLKRAADEMLEYGDSGQSVMEMSHRSKEYQAIIDSVEAKLRQVMSIPDNYKVLFLQGGASSQFAMIPLNLMNRNNKADFVITGQWANKAYQEASRYGKCNVVASSKDKTFSYIPELDKSKFDPEADYFHICYNNTIYGTRFNELPADSPPPNCLPLSLYVTTSSKGNHHAEVARLCIFFDSIDCLFAKVFCFGFFVSKKSSLPSHL